MKRNAVIAGLVFGLGVLAVSSIAGDLDAREKSHRQIAERRGSLEHYKRGKEILRKLSSLRGDEQKKFDIGAYRGERVAFVGGTASPGATNDLMAEHGFYLRVVNPDGKDLRPHSVWWEVLVCGEVLQVLPENKIVVIEVAEEDWTVIQTG